MTTPREALAELMPQMVAEAGEDDHIAALTKERDEINLTCRGFEADAISRELDILNLETELAAQLRQGADAVRMAEAGKVLRSEVERWSAILDNDVMRKATDAYDAAITDTKQEV